MRFTVASAILCADVDECYAGAHSCDEDGALCVNTGGSYTCSCAPGFAGDGIDCDGESRTCCCVSAIAERGGWLAMRNCHCDVIQGWGEKQVLVSSGFRADVDECFEGASDCDLALGRCENNPGSYSCSCLPGFVGDGTICAGDLLDRFVFAFFCLCCWAITATGTNDRFRYKRSLPQQMLRFVFYSNLTGLFVFVFLLWNQTTTSALRMLLTMFRRRTKPRITALHPTAHHRIARVSWTPIRGLSTVSWGGTWIVDVLSRVFKGSCVTQHRAFPAWNIHLQPRLLRHTTILSLPKNYRLAARYRLSYRPTGVSWAYWRTGIFVGRCSHRHAMTGSLHTGVVVDEIMEFRAPSWALLCSRDHCVDIHVEQKAGKNISAKESRTCVHGLR